MPANAPRLATLGLSAALTLSACGGGGPSGPLARDDTARTTPGTAVSILVLANDVASRGQPSLDTFDTRGDNGTVVRDERGTPDNRRDDRLVYTPDGGFTGVDRFTYRIVDDRGRSDEATVTVTVTDSGVALDDVFNVERDSSDNRLDVLANDSESMRVVALDTADAQPGSRIVIAEDGGAVSYTPPAGYTGADIFRYTAERTVDGNTERDEAEVQVNVQEPPPASNACREDIVARLDAGLGYCYDAKLTTTAGIVIDFTVFVPHPDALRANAEATTGAPLAADEPGFAPLLIHGHGYGGSKYGDFSDPQTFLDSHIAKLAWEAGYFVITFSERGFGQSGGQIGVMSPRKEGFDFVELVNWANVHLREHFGFDARDSDNVAFDAGTASHTDPDAAPDPAWGRSLLQTDSLTRVTAFDAGVPEGDIALATIGYSYGGGFQFNAQSVDPRVDAMIPMGTWFDLRYSLHPNDTPKSTWITLLTTFTVEGGNGEDPPPVIVDANSEAFGANRDSNDQPHNKARQVSVRNLRKLSPNGPVAYCDGGENLDPDPGFVPINDATESEGEAPPVPPNAVTERAARAHLLMVQGYGDTLFNFNEGYDNARCFESQGAPGLDVRYLAETSGHPLPPPAGPPQYAGSNTSMYLDEIVHCGTAADGAPRRYTMREVGLAWFDYHLRGLLPADTNGDGLRNADDIFPRACIVQVNTDTRLRLKTGDDNPAFSGTNTEATAFEWPREGAVFERRGDGLRPDRDRHRRRRTRRAGHERLRRHRPRPFAAESRPVPAAVHRRRFARDGRPAAGGLAGHAQQPGPGRDLLRRHRHPPLPRQQRRRRRQRDRLRGRQRPQTAALPGQPGARVPDRRGRRPGADQHRHRAVPGRRPAQRAAGRPVLPAALGGQPRFCRQQRHAPRPADRRFRAPAPGRPGGPAVLRRAPGVQVGQQCRPRPGEHCRHRGTAAARAEPGADPGSGLRRTAGLNPRGRRRHRGHASNRCQTGTVTKDSRMPALRIAAASGASRSWRMARMPAVIIGAIAACNTATSRIAGSTPSAAPRARHSAGASSSFQARPSDTARPRPATARKRKRSPTENSATGASVAASASSTGSTVGGQPPVAPTPMASSRPRNGGKRSTRQTIALAGKRSPAKAAAVARPIVDRARKEPAWSANTATGSAASPRSAAIIGRPRNAVLPKPQLRIKQPTSGRGQPSRRPSHGNSAQAPAITSHGTSAANSRSCAGRSAGIARSTIAGRATFSTQ